MKRKVRAKGELAGACLVRLVVCRKQGWPGDTAYKLRKDVQWNEQVPTFMFVYFCLGS